MERPTTEKTYKIRCEMCSSDEDCPYDHIPEYPCKTFLALVEAEGMCQGVGGGEP